MADGNHSMVQTDKIRDTFEKSTGKNVPDKVSN
jgi:hypothetical protein